MNDKVMALSKDVIEIVISITDISGTYSRHAGALLASIFANTKSIVRIHVLTDETLSIENRGKFIEMAAKWQQQIVFYDIPLDKFNDIEKKHPVIEHLSRAALYRLLIPDLILVNKCIYLDIDIIVNLDITELWNQHLDGHPLGAVRDVAHTLKNVKRNPYFKNAGISSTLYFNSGVLLMDIAKIKSLCHLIDMSIDFLVRYPGAPNLDQEALNSFFGKKVKFLPNKFNYIVGEYYNDKNVYKRPMIWHFAGQWEKPWNGINSEEDKLYWKYLLQSRWNSIDDITFAIENCQLGLYPLEKIVLTQKSLNKKTLLKVMLQRAFKEMAIKFF